ncbi:hypothetical protein ACOMHN_025799 [Nucella lapillus]
MVKLLLLVVSCLALTASSQAANIRSIGCHMMYCFVQPCLMATCSYPNAKCVDDYCGGCNHHFFAPDGRELSLTECQTTA